MNDFDSIRMNQFRADIGLDALPLAGSVVAAAWSDPLKLGVLDPKWRIVYDDVILAYDMVLHQWDLEFADGGGLFMEIAVSSKGVEIARSYLVRTAASTTMRNIPYRRDPEGFGELTLVPVTQGPAQFFWIYRNVCFRLRLKENAALDLVPLAKALQAQAEHYRFADLSAALPPMPVVQSPAVPVKKGASFDIALILPQDSDTKHLLSRLADLPDILTLMHQDGHKFNFAARAVGKGELVFVLIDARTLLQREVRVAVEISDAATQP